MISRLLRNLGTALCVLVICLAGTAAFSSPTYNGTPAEDFCVSCHPSFVNRDTLHDNHVGSQNFTGNCNNCHRSPGDNPFLMYSEGDFGNGLGCAGCHGRDYGETIQANHGEGLLGKPKASGYGLRLQHLNKGVMQCITCHTTDDQVQVQPESTSPPYYARADVNITDSCNTDGTEDTSPEPNGEDTVGLDNDGDLLIDGADPDCGAASGPGETGGALMGRLVVTTRDDLLGSLNLTVGINCGATNQTLIWGPLSAVSSYGYSGQDCLMDNTGNHTWTFGTGSGSLFFLVVGNDGLVEGSYGIDSSGVERPEDTLLATCPMPQDLMARCD